MAFSRIWNRFWEYIDYFDAKWYLLSWCASCKTFGTYSINFHHYPPTQSPWCAFNTLRPRQNGRHFADDMFKCIFLNENVWIPIEISLKFVPEGSVNNDPSLFQIMAWRRPGDKPLSEPMIVSSQTHISVTRPQWVNTLTLIYLDTETEMCLFDKSFTTYHTLSKWQLPVQLVMKSSSK